MTKPAEAGLVGAKSYLIMALYKQHIPYCHHLYKPCR